MSDTKRCSKCGRELPLTSEYFRPHKRDKWAQPCNMCAKIALKEWRLANPDKVRASARRYAKQRYYRQREVELARTKKWKQEHKEYIRQKDKEYKDKTRERRKMYYIEHPEIKMKQRQYYRRLHPDKRREKIHRYFQRYPDKRKQYRHTYEARKRNLPDRYLSAHWLMAIAYWKGGCAICGRPRGLWHTLAADHWIPLSNPNCPGTIPTNILPLCHGIEGCNNSKNNRDPIEWLVERLGKRKAKKKLAEIEAYFEWIANQ